MSESSRATLSVCMIVRDEAACLAKCLTSVVGLASEIVVVDTGSCDQSREIATQFKARVLSIDWNDDFAEARNVSLRAATCDWVLVLDADEYLAEESVPRMLEFLASRPAPATIKIRNLCLDSFGRPSKAYFLVRLFANLPQLRFTQAFHEYLRDEGNPALPQLFRPELVLIHTGYENQVTIEKAKLCRNRNMLERLQRREPDQIIWKYYSANLHSVAKQPEPALGEYLALLQLTQWSEQAFFQRAVIEAMACCLELKRFLQGLQLAEQFTGVCQDIPDFWYYRGVLFRHRRDLAQALNCFETCLNFQSKESALQSQYAPVCVFEGPLLQILQIHRSQMHSPVSNLLQRQDAWRAYQDAVLRSLRPDRQGYYLPVPGMDPQFNFGPFWLIHLVEAIAMGWYWGLPCLSGLLERAGSSTDCSLVWQALACLNQMRNPEIMQILGRIQTSCLMAQTENALSSLKKTVQYLLVAAGIQNVVDYPEMQRSLPWMILHTCLVWKRQSFWALLHAKWWHLQGSETMARQVLLEAQLMLPENPILNQAFALASESGLSNAGNHCL